MIRTLMILLSISSLSQASFFKDHAEGWFWYKDPLPEEEEELKPDLPKQEEKALEKTLEKERPFTKMTEEFQKDLKEAKAKAIWNPTPENVAVYQRLQQRSMNQAEGFAETWKYNLFTNPALDENVKHPMSQVGRHAEHDMERAQKDRLIQALKKDYGLFYFYKGNCPHCTNFSPIVKQFSTKHGWDLVAISTDGSPNEVFADWQNDNGWSETLGVKMFPALFAVNPQTGDIIQVGYGLLSVQEMEERLVQLVNYQGKTQ